MDNNQQNDPTLISANDKVEAQQPQGIASDNTINYSQPANYKPSRTPSSTQTEQGSFVKLAMRNMVKKGGTSLFHFFLTIVGVIGTLVGLAIAFH